MANGTKNTQHLDYALIAQRPAVFCSRFIGPVYAKSPNETVGIDGLGQKKCLQPFSFEQGMGSSRSLLVLSCTL